MRPAFSPLRVPAFGRLLSSYAINETGDSVGVIALALLVYGETDSALATTALFLAANVAPAFVAPTLTARVDRFAVHRTLPVLYVLEALAFVALGLTAGSFVLPLVLALAFVDGTLALTGRSLTRGAVGALLEPRGMLREGNALVNIAFALASVGGAALGGVLAGEAGIAFALYVDAASFAVIAVVTAGARAVPRPEVAPSPAARRLRESLRFVRAHARLRVLILAEGGALILFTLIVPIEVIYARDVLDTDETGYGLLLAAWGAGLVVGSLVFAAAKGRSLLALTAASTAAIGVAYLGMSLCRDLAPAMALAVLGGTGNGVQWVAVLTAVQEETPVKLHARVMGLLESMNRAAPAVGFVAGGVLATAFSPQAAFAISGGGLLVLLAAAAVAWQLRRGAGDRGLTVG